MADVIVTIKIMPESPNVDLTHLEEIVKKEIRKFTKEASSQMKTDIEPVAFGLKALKIIFIMDESLGSPDPLTEKLSMMEDIASAEVFNVTRAIG